jgi:hypothetical protein
VVHRQKPICNTMLSNYLPLPDLQDAPPVVRGLREAFDKRLESLHAAALAVQSREPDHATRMLHVPFTFGQYDVEAMYDREQDLFTQLVARPKSGLEDTRPAYTISLFLVADKARRDPSA